MKTPEEIKLEKMIYELTEYAKLDNSGLGEVCFNLMNLLSSKFLSETLKLDITRELEWRLRNYKEMAKIVVENSAITPKIKTLIWKDIHPL